MTGADVNVNEDRPAKKADPRQAESGLANCSDRKLWLNALRVEEAQMASGTVWPDGLGRVLPSVVRITLGEAALMEKDAEAVHVVRRRERV